MNKLMFLAMAGAAILLGQEPISSIGGPPRPVPEFDAVQQQLVLTADQMAKLQQIRQARLDADQLIYQQIHQKHQELGRLMDQGSTDALAIGRLMIDIRELNKQGPGQADKYIREATAVLNPVQKQQLQVLHQALALQRAAQEAIYLNLLPVRSPEVRILPVPAEISGAPSVGR